ncbi:MAG: hypothetical protein Q4G45_08930 [Actinomycetia bacterium]|nr:hypothetical protein [Actinomycetes bacterium]
MGLTLPGGLAEALSLMGVEFPGTDESALTAAAGEWRSLASQCSGWHSELASAVSHVQSNNEGAGVEAFAAYMGGQSNVTGVEALGKACEAIATGHETAAGLVVALKTAYIAAATALKAQMESAKQQPDADPAAMMAWAQQAGAKLRQLDSQTASQIQGG